MESKNKDVKLSCDEPKNGPKHHVQSINIAMREKTNTADRKKTISSESQRSSFNKSLLTINDKKSYKNKHTSWSQRENNPTYLTCNGLAGSWPLNNK
jgi:hypothetical protein